MKSFSKMFSRNIFIKKIQKVLFAETCQYPDQNMVTPAIYYFSL